MILINLKYDDYFDSKRWEAEVYTLQTREWMRSCPQKNRCPAAALFNHLDVLFRENMRLQHEIDRMENWPNER